MKTFCIVYGDVRGYTTAVSIDDAAKKLGLQRVDSTEWFLDGPKVHRLKLVELPNIENPASLRRVLER